MPEDIIRLKVANLCKQYGKTLVVKNLSFEVAKGEIVGFLGVNGAGKSTTIKIIAGLVSLTSGKIEINGVKITGDAGKKRKDIGVMFEAPSFYNYLSAYNNLEILARLSNGKQADINGVLKTVGLSGASKMKVGKYSQGMRQRLGFAQAILTKPSVLILDEPTNGLDPNGIKDIKDLIHRLAKEENVAIFLSSHVLSEVERLCDRVIIINQGELVASKKVNELLAEGIHSLEQFFLDLTQGK